MRKEIISAFNQEQIEQLDMAVQMCQEDRLLQDQLLRATGHRVLLSSFVKTDVDARSSFMSEASKRIEDGDRVGPVVIAVDGYAAIHGLAVWRMHNDQTRVP